MVRRRLLLLLATTTQAYRWELETSYGTSNKVSFSELYMYGSNQGPWPWKGGRSRVDVDLEWTVRKESMTDIQNVTLVALELNEELNLDDVDLCRGLVPSYVKHVPRTAQFPLEVIENLNETDDFVFQGFIDHRFRVKETGRQVVVMQNCPGFRDGTFHLNGAVAFRNPYGMLPAMYFGFLPFEGARALGFLSLLIYLGFLLRRHYDKLIVLHYAIFAVAFVATCEAWTWFLAYVALNKSGTPLCCPFRPVVVAAMSLQAVQQTSGRALLLTVALGFGLVRSRLSFREEIFILTLSLAYLISSIVATAVKVQNHNHLDDVASHEDDDDHDDDTVTENQNDKNELWTDAPALLFELIFLAWIYTALVNVTDLLRSQGQTYKLHMFNLLNYTIATFVALTTLLTIIVVLAKLNFFLWPWQLYWLQIVSLEALNFAVLAAVCVIWRPTDRSHLLVKHHQIATSDDQLDDDDFDDNGIELT